VLKQIGRCGYVVGFAIDEQERGIRLTPHPQPEEAPDHVDVNERGHLGIDCVFDLKQRAAAMNAMAKDIVCAFFGGALVQQRL